jgi:hypothetical protein
MDIYQIIIDTYPELDTSDFSPSGNKIKLKDDGDGIVYLGEWNYSKPIPDGLTLGKPLA